jgi:hypothetical protein
MAAQDIEEFYFAFAKQNNGQNIIDIKIFFTSLQQNYGYFLVPHKILLHLGQGSETGGSRSGCGSFRQILWITRRL